MRTTLTLDDLYPDAAAEIPVSLALPAPRRPDPPVERRNLGRWQDYYAGNILTRLDVDDGQPLALIDKAYPHALYDLLMLVADEGGGCTNTSAAAETTLTAMLATARAFATFTADPNADRRYGLAGGQAGIGWNYDPTVDRDNGQWWDKRLHWHLNYWTSAACQASAPIPLGAVADSGVRRTVVDPAAFIGADTLADRLRATGAIPPGCRLLETNLQRDAALALPVGVKIVLPGWEFTRTRDAVRLLRAIHLCAAEAYDQVRGCFTDDPPPAAWARPALLAPQQVRDRLTSLEWLAPTTLKQLLRLRAALRDVTARELQLLATRNPVANRCLTLAGLSYHCALHAPLAGGLYLVVQTKLISSIGSSPAIGGAAATIVDRFGTPPMTRQQLRLRADFQNEFIDLAAAAVAQTKRHADADAAA